MLWLIAPSFDSFSFLPSVFKSCHTDFVNGLEETEQQPPQSCSRSHEHQSPQGELPAPRSCARKPKIATFMIIIINNGAGARKHEVPPTDFVCVFVRMCAGRSQNASDSNN